MRDLDGSMLIDTSHRSKLDVGAGHDCIGAITAVVGSCDS